MLGAAVEINPMMPWPQRLTHGAGLPNLKNPQTDGLVGCVQRALSRALGFVCCGAFDAILELGQ